MCGASRGAGGGKSADASHLLLHLHLFQPSLLLLLLLLGAALGQQLVVERRRLPLLGPDIDAGDLAPAEELGLRRGDLRKQGRLGEEGERWGVLATGSGSARRKRWLWSRRARLHTASEAAPMASKATPTASKATPTASKAARAHVPGAFPCRAGCSPPTCPRLGPSQTQTSSRSSVGSAALCAARQSIGP